MDRIVPHIRAISWGSRMSVENIYYKRIKELETENSVLSKEVITLRKEIKQLKEQRDFLQNDLVDRSQKLEELKND